MTPGRSYQFGAFRLDAGGRVLFQGSDRVALTPKAVDVLVALVEARDRPVGRDELLHKVWAGKLFDLGVFTVEPAEHRVIFSQHAISGGRGMEGELQFHGRAIHAPQHVDLLPAAEFLAWNTKNVFKTPARQVVPAGATPRAAR